MSESVGWWSPESSHTWGSFTPEFSVSQGTPLVSIRIVLLCLLGWEGWASPDVWCPQESLYWGWSEMRPRQMAQAQKSPRVRSLTNLQRIEPIAVTIPDLRTGTNNFKAQIWTPRATEMSALLLCITCRKQHTFRSISLKLKLKLQFKIYKSF